MVRNIFAGRNGGILLKEDQHRPTILFAYNYQAVSRLGYYTFIVTADY
jgi:hypothetical protein